MLAINAPLELDDMLAAIARQARLITHSQRSAVYLHDADTNTLQLVIDHRLPPVAAGVALAQRVLGTRRIMVADRAQGAAALPPWADRTMLVSLAAQGRHRGVLQVARGRGGQPYTRDEIAALEWFAPLAAQTLANSHELYHCIETIGEFQISTERLRAVGNIAFALMDAGYDPERMAALALDRACRSLRMCGGAVRRYDEHTGQLQTIVERDMPAMTVARLDTAGTMVSEPISDPDEQGICHIPLVAQERLVGLLQLVSPPGRVLCTDDRDALAMIANQLALGLENARLFQQVQTNEQQWRAILDSTDNVVLSVDLDGRLLTANAAAERALGFAAAERIGGPLAQATTNVTLNQVLDQARVQRDARRRTFQVPLADDRVLFVSMSPIVNADGAAQGWVLVMQDVTQLQEMDRLRADMIMTASHELRNPINLTLGALEMLDRHLDSGNALQRESFDLARLGMERAQSLITDLLDLEGIERHVAIRREPCNCTAFLRALDAEFQLRAYHRRITFQVRVPDQDLVVWGDRRLLHRVMSNLVDNAFKYTSPGGQVTVEARSEAGQAILEVSDNGPGIPLEAQPLIFERFYRLANQSDNIEGTGLGLTIVKSIVDQHGGRVWVTSRPGQGATFTVSLPIFYPTTR
jgi:two-component system phosphate regulon sensor histidine kinase PhoR